LRELPGLWQNRNGFGSAPCVALRRKTGEFAFANDFDLFHSIDQSVDLKKVSQMNSITSSEAAKETWMSCASKTARSPGTGCWQSSFAYAADRRLDSAVAKREIRA